MSALLRNKVIALWNKAGTEEEQVRTDPPPTLPSAVQCVTVPPFFHDAPRPLHSSRCPRHHQPHITSRNPSRRARPPLLSVPCGRLGQ